MILFVGVIKLIALQSVPSADKMVQLMKRIKEFNDDNSISCELLLIKMLNDPDSRGDIQSAADAFGAITVDYSKDTIILQLTDSSRKIDDFINLMRDYTILEICRTGSVSLEKGSTTIRQTINL